MFFRSKMIYLALILLPFSLRAELTFLDRVLFSDKAYVKNIKAEVFILTQEQICKVLCTPNLQIEQLSNDELYGKDTYLFFLLKNGGSKEAWGNLAVTVPSFHHPIDIPIPSLSNNGKPQFYMFYLGIVVSPNKPSGYPKITYKWDKLYTK
jgi:hypothetical protein